MKVTVFLFLFIGYFFFIHSLPLDEDFGDALSDLNPQELGEDRVQNVEELAESERMKRSPFGIIEDIITIITITIIMATITMDMDGATTTIIIITMGIIMGGMVITTTTTSTIMGIGDRRSTCSCPPVDIMFICFIFYAADKIPG
uniref:Secreted protein n=1 Tax=Lutzomyia longipalpis TaxID=7200 RepID=A0A1B0EU28_LUTLO